jgi:hypothetical protein
MPRLSIFALVGFATLAFSTAASATCTTYHMLTNGNPADASQVMDNFNNILGCAQFTGNISIRTAPSAWGSLFDTAVDIGPAAALATISSLYVFDMENNMYYNGSNYIRKTSGYGQLFRMGGNDYQWYQASNASAGSVVSLSQIMHLDFSGNLTISGCLYYNPSSLGTCLSDLRVKRNIKSFTKVGLAEISALRPVTYSYNGLADTPDDIANGTERDGLIAQEVLKVAPDLVSTIHRKLKPSDRATTALLEVNYGALSFGVINAVKELKATNDSQAAQIERQAAQIERLEKSVVTLQRKLGVQTAER